MLSIDFRAAANAALEQMTEGREFIEAAAMEANSTAFRSPSVRRAMIEGYRAAMDEDLAQHARPGAGGVSSVPGCAVGYLKPLTGFRHRILEIDVCTTTGRLSSMCNLRSKDQ